LTNSTEPKTINCNEEEVSTGAPGSFVNGEKKASSKKRRGEPRGGAEFDKRSREDLYQHAILGGDPSRKGEKCKRGHLKAKSG